MGISSHCSRRLWMLNIDRMLATLSVFDEVRWNANLVAFLEKFGGARHRRSPSMMYADRSVLHRP